MLKNFLLIFVNKFIKTLKFTQKYSDKLFVIRSLTEYFNMIKKITTPSNSRCESVELILRGAKKRRTLAYGNANMINSESGIKANLSAVK